MSAAELREMEEETAITNVKRESISILDRAKALIVNDQQSYNLATDLYKAALAVEKAADAAHDPVIAHWHDLHKTACANKKADKDLATQAKVLAKSKASAWQDEQERIRREAERKAQEEARRIAEERARIAREAAEAERRRIEAEEEAERLRLAEDAEASGATAEEVTEILATPLYEAPVIVPEPVAPVVMPTVAPTFQKAAGFNVRTVYGAKVVDLTALIRAAAANPAFEMFLCANMPVINQVARKQKEAFRVPGCQLDPRRA